MRPELRARLDTLPPSSGVYLMRDAQGEIFYVGKAKSLRDRLRSYFSGQDTRAFVALLDELLADVEVILTSSEKEAFLLENELIKKHQPRFNVKLVDDKRFLCLRLDTRHAYPRLDVVRRFGKDGARYFGPYPSASNIRESLRIINRYFQLRTCSDEVLRSRDRPCLQYQIKRCPAPCVFDLSGGTYAANVRAVATFLEGRTHELLDDLETRMKSHAERLEFEQAAQVRDQRRAVMRSVERQRVISTDERDRDVIGLYREGPAVEIVILRSRGGKLIDSQRFSFADLEQPTSELLADFAGRYYAESRNDLPMQILFPLEMAWADTLATVLEEREKRRVEVLTPQRGDKRRLVELAEKNAHQAFVDKQREHGAARTAVERLQRSLHLHRPPERIECVDISHLQGSQIVASVVHLEAGVPKKERYRHYRIRSTETQDDYKSIYEVVARRARRGLEEGDLPDLLVIDGGKGQLQAARAALDDHGVDGIDLVSLAKSRIEGEGGDSPERSPERVFVQGVKNPIVLRQNSAELFLLTRARDEAHRFALRFHRTLRRKAATHSWLDDVPGIGKKRRRDLLRHFGSVAKVSEATPEQLVAVVGAKAAGSLSAALAQRANATEAGET